MKTLRFLFYGAVSWLLTEKRATRYYVMACYDYVKAAREGKVGKELRELSLKYEFWRLVIRLRKKNPLSWEEVRRLDSRFAKVELPSQKK